MTMCFSLRIAELMTNRLGCDVGVKWPNDVVTKGGKLCGILSESTTRGRRVDVVIVGIGINVNMERSQFPPGVPAVSCLSVTGRRHDRRDLLTDVLGVLEDGYAGFLGSGFSPLIDRYVARLVLMGKTVVFQRGGEKVVAEVTGVEPDGALAVRSRDGRTVKLYDEEIRSQQEPS